jgi:hypothetical protein
VKFATKEKIMENIEQGWHGVEVIHAYTRAQALEDGVLADISELAREAGFKFPVAVTQGVWEILNPTNELKAAGQDLTERTWDLLTILRHAIRAASNTDAIRFAPLFLREPGQKIERIDMWAKCGPGDEAEPVITVMLKGED